MSDILDEIIDRLPPSTIRKIMNFDDNNVNIAVSVNNLLQDVQQIKFNQLNRELNRKIFDIKSKTDENKKHLIKLKKELQSLKSLKSTGGCDRSVKAYSSKINELEAKMKSLTINHGNIDLTQLFLEIDDLNHQIEDHKNKITKAKIVHQAYDGFPPDIEKGKEVIIKLKEQIKHEETMVQSLFQS